MSPYACTDTHGYAALARALAPRKPITVSQWADLERGLSSKGSAQPGRWVTANNPPLREPMDCMSSRSTVREVVLMFPVQMGKALALDTPIATPTGWTTMGDIQTGDTVFGQNGQPTTVIATSEVFTDHLCYRITFSDGAQIVADAGHRWNVIDLQRCNEARKEIKRREARKEQGMPQRRRMEVSPDESSHERILTTEEIAVSHRSRRNSRYAVRLTEPLDMPDAILPIDPYTLGVWLGDGNSASAQITQHINDAPHIINQLEKAGYTVVERANRNGTLTLAIDPHGHRNGMCRRGHILANVGTYSGMRGGKTTTTCAECARQAAMKWKNGNAMDAVIYKSFHSLLIESNLLKNKHIPIEYLRASRRQRLELLQGLMDTDGTCATSGECEITSSYPVLANGIIDLIRTLGIKPGLSIKKTKTLDSWRIRFTAYSDMPVFSLPRKLSRQAIRAGRGVAETTRRHISKVEQVATVPTRCIAVNNANHLFLCGRELIPTHNTEVAINALGYCMDHDPGPVMVCLPGEVSMDKWVAQKLHPAIDESPAVKRSLTSVSSRDASNTRTFKDFAGGQLYIEHAGSPARLKSTSVRTLIVDEVDEFANNFGGGDDPLEMLKARTSAFPSTSKRLYISTPQIKGRSRIEDLWLQSDQRHYHVPCPHCGHCQPLEWSGMGWSQDGQQVWYVCQECGAMIDEQHKTRMIGAGEWVAHNVGAKMRGYHINCLYYQIGLGPRWAEMVSDWRTALNDPAKLKTFTNDRLAQPWEDAAMRNVRHDAIADRVEPYALRTAPLGVLCITAGVDTQDNRLAVQIVGWGRGMAFWILDYIELPGDPASPEVWTSLTELINRPIQHASGGVLRVEALAQDAGGHRTEHVKAFAYERRIKRPMVIFGAIANNAPVLSKGKVQEFTWRGAPDKRSVMIYHVGTVAVKHWIYSQLGADADKAPDLRQTHFSGELSPDYFPGLVSETFNPHKNRFDKKRGARNEALDTLVYAFAAAHHPELRLHRFSSKDWDALEVRLTGQADNVKTIVSPTPVTPDSYQNDIVPSKKSPVTHKPAPPPKSFRRDW